MASTHPAAVKIEDKLVATTHPAAVMIEDKLVATTHPAAVMILMVAILSSSVNGGAGRGRSADPPPDMSTKTT